MQPNNLCIFPRGLWWAKLRVISPVELFFWSMSFEGDCRSAKVFQVEFLSLKHPILEHLSKIFLKKLAWKKVSDNNSIRLSYADIFQHNTNYQGHGYLFHNMIRISKVKSEQFCQTDGTKSRENFFTSKQGWQNIFDC